MRPAVHPLLLLLAACSHETPFAGQPPPSASGPFSSTVPTRLTFNVGADRTPAWSADGLTIYYSAQDSFGLDKDRCNARLPAGGGTRTLVTCPAALPNGITEWWEQPAPRGNQLAYVTIELGVNEHAAFRSGIWLAPLDSTSPARKVRDFSYNDPNGRPHDTALFLQWLRPGVLLYLGAENGCCRKDTLRFGESVAELDVSGASPVLSFVPGIDSASSVQAARDGTAFYYTLYGDSRVYRRDLVTGQDAVVHDFGAGHLPRDVQVAGNRLVAVVDGQPGYRPVPPLGTVYLDHGGFLVTVDLGTGIETAVPDGGRMYRRPVFSPAGDRMVVEGYPYQVVPTGPFTSDTIVSRWADLWLLEE
jgi:hypothetical protein